MTERTVVEAKIKVGKRLVRVRGMDSVGPEDCFENALSAVLHRYITSEDLLMPVPREVKDFMIKNGLAI